MNPLIFYRVSKPVKDISKLPILNLAKFYEQAKDEEQIKFTVKRIKLGSNIEKNYISMISKEETKSNFELLDKFSTEDDRQLMKCLDKYIEEEMKEKEVTAV